MLCFYAHSGSWSLSQHGTRWEPLMVTLLLSTTYLQTMFFGTCSSSALIPLPFPPFFPFLYNPWQCGIFSMPCFSFHLAFNYYSHFEPGSWWIFSRSCVPGWHPKGETGKKWQKGETAKVKASCIWCQGLNDRSIPAENRPARGRTIVLLFCPVVINKRMKAQQCPLSRKKGFFLYFSFLSVFSFLCHSSSLSCRQSYVEKCCFHMHLIF